MRLAAFLLIAVAAARTQPVLTLEAVVARAPETHRDLAIAGAALTTLTLATGDSATTPAQPVLTHEAAVSPAPETHRDLAIAGAAAATLTPATGDTATPPSQPVLTHEAAVSPAPETHRDLAIAGAAVTTLTPATGDTATPPSLPLLTLEAAVASALETHPDLAAARASRAVADFQIQAARSLPPLELRLVANNFALDPDAGPLRNSIGWKWSPPRPRELALRAKVARVGRQIAEAEIQAAELRIANAVRLAYRRAALSADRARLAAQTRELRQSLLDTVRRQVAAGVKEALEADLAELALADADAARSRADSAAATEMRRLTHLIGRTEFTLLTPPLSAPHAPALLDRALRSRPDLARAAAACREAGATVSLAANRRYPWLNGVQLTRRMDANDWGLQAGVDLPIFRSAARWETRVATAAAERCRLEELALRARVRHEVEDAAAQWSAAQAELEKLDQLSAGPASRALARLRAALDQGKADRTDVLLAEARLLALRDRWLERRLDLAVIESQLELAVAILY